MNSGRCTVLERLLAQPIGSWTVQISIRLIDPAAAPAAQTTVRSPDLNCPHSSLTSADLACLYPQPHSTTVPRSLRAAAPSLSSMSGLYSEADLSVDTSLNGATTGPFSVFNAASTAIVPSSATPPASAADPSAALFDALCSSLSASPHCTEHFPSSLAATPGGSGGCSLTEGQRQEVIRGLNALWRERSQALRDYQTVSFCGGAQRSMQLWLLHCMITLAHLSLRFAPLPLSPESRGAIHPAQQARRRHRSLLHTQAREIKSRARLVGDRGAS